MSGKAWDSSTEYCLPEGYTPWGEALGDEEDEYEAIELTPEQREQALRALFGSGEGMNAEEMQADVNAFWDKVLVEEKASGPGNVQTTTLEELNLKPKQGFMYLFDYGDEWRFKVHVHAINEDADPMAGYPHLVESVGGRRSSIPTGAKAKIGRRRGASVPG